MSKKRIENIKNEEIEEKREKIKRKLKRAANIKRGIEAVLAIFSLVCIFVPEQVNKIFPYLIGMLLVSLSILKIVEIIIEKTYQDPKHNKIPITMVIFLMGILIMIKGQEAIPLIGITWGLIGIMKSTLGFHIAIYNKSQKKKYKLELLHSIAEMILSMLLIFNPFEKMSEHIVLFGIDTIFMKLKYFFKDTEYNDEKEKIV